MNPSTPIQPGSIKARIIEAIIDLGDGATSHAIRKRHPSNEALVDKSLGDLSTEGYIQVTSEGNFELTPAARRVIKGETITQAVAAIRSNAAEIRSEASASAPAASANAAPATGQKIRCCVLCRATKSAD